jgi:4-hydroxybenzoate polyprenyltransferase
MQVSAKSLLWKAGGWHCGQNKTPEVKMLWTIFVILVVLWLLGLAGSIGGSLIHTLLVIAAIILVYNLMTGRRGVVR